MGVRFEPLTQQTEEIGHGKSHPAVELSMGFDPQMGYTVSQADAEKPPGDKQPGTVSEPEDEIVELLESLGKSRMIGDEEVSLPAYLDVKILKRALVLPGESESHPHIIEYQIGYPQTLFGIVSIHRELHVVKIRADSIMDTSWLVWGEKPIQSYFQKQNWVILYPQVKWLNSSLWAR